MFENIITYRASIDPDGIALIMQQTAIPFGRFATDIESVAAGLNHFGLPPKCVVLISDSRPYIHWLLLLGLERLGCVSVSDDAAARTFEVVKPDVIIAETDAQAGRTSRFLHTTADWVNATLTGKGTFSRQLASPDDPVRIGLSSGTTGVPKQLLNTRRQIDTRVIQTLAGPLPPALRTLIMMGLDTGAYETALTTWIVGGTVIYAGGLSPAQALIQHRPNFAIMAPIQLQHLLAGLPADFERRDDLRIGLSGSVTPARLLKATKQRLTNDVMFAYASSEAGIMAIGPSRVAEEVAGGTGYAAPWATVEIVGPDGNVLPRGEVGRLRARTMAMSQHYRSERPEDSGGAFVDGWFYPGDVASVAADGLIVLEGRDDDVLNLGGAKISAFSIEEALLSNDGIEDAAAFLLPDADGLPHLHAAIVKRPRANAASIEATVKEKLRQPLMLIIVAAIPRNRMGKIARKELIASVEAGLAARKL